MKKITAIILALVVSMSFATDSFGLARNYVLLYQKFMKNTSEKAASDSQQAAGTENSKDGAPGTSYLKDVTCFSRDKQDEISIYADSYKDYNIFTLANPNRIVVDIPRTTASATQKTIDVDSNLVKSIRYAQYEEGTARIVIDLQDQAQYQVEEKNDRLVLYVIDPISENAVYYLDENKGKLLLTGIKLCTDENGELVRNYTESYSSDGKRYSVSFSNTLGSIKSTRSLVNDSLIDAINVFRSVITRKTSITFSGKTKLYYKIEPKPEIDGTLITFSEKYDDISEPPTTNRGDYQRGPASKIAVSYSSIGGSDIITILADKYDGYNIMRLTDPDRIVIDIPNASAPASQQTINASSSRLSGIRYAQFDDSTARIVLDTKGMAPYDIDEKDGRLVVKLKNPTYKNIIYHSNGDRIYLTLAGAKLTEGGQDLKKFYTGSYDAAGKQYTITFPSSLADVGYGEIKINDGLLESVKISTSVLSKNTSITFNAKDKFVYEVMTRPSVDNTAITILKPFSKNDKLVVIDAGHGDTEPGAIYGNLQEKTLNVDIAVRLNSLLKKRNVKTYIIREDDSYVGLYERAYIANSLNATLFLSIHNNAFNSSEHGTETLYMPGRTNAAGFSSKRFAQIIQNELVGQLNSFDRKIKERPGLVVLKATKMPSALAEVAFITNTEERKKLLDENFRQKAAEALCDAVVKALKEN